ncbi:MAG: LapA family protein [Ferrimicrobium sp.]
MDEPQEPFVDEEQTQLEAPQDVLRSSDVSPAPKRTRTAATWAGLLIAIIVLIVILVFILENLTSVPVGIFGAIVRMPVGVAILFGVVLGGLLVFLVGAARILQVRRSNRNRA